MNNVALGFLATVLLLAAFASGLVSGGNLAATSCDDFGKFKRAEVYYDCKRVEVTK